MALVLDLVVQEQELARRKSQNDNVQCSADLSMLISEGSYGYHTTPKSMHCIQQEPCMRRNILGDC